MMKTINLIILTFTVYLLASCYEDKGNYTYLNFPEIKLDTTNQGLSEPIIINQMDNLIFPIDSVLHFDGNKDDLSFSWSVCLQKLPELPVGVSQYDSAVVISNNANINIPIKLLPNDYFLFLRVTENVHNTSSLMVFRLKVQLSSSSGLLIYYEDENKNADLMMIQSPFFEKNRKESVVIDKIYSSLEYRKITSPTFLALYPPQLYLFAEDGGTILNSISYALYKSDFRQLFSFPSMVSLSPSAHAAVQNRKELLLLNQLIYCFDHAGMGVSGYGDQLTGDYNLAPFIASLGTSNTAPYAAIVFDTKQNAFCPIDRFCMSVNSFESTVSPFNIAAIDKEERLINLQQGYNQYTYAIFEKNGLFSLYVANFMETQPMPLAKYILTNFHGNNDTRFAFSRFNEFAYYGFNNSLYLMNYKQDSHREIYNFGQETITNLKLLSSNEEVDSKKILVVSTKLEDSKGKIYLMPIDISTGNITNNEQIETFEVNGLIVDFLYK